MGIVGDHTAGDKISADHVTNKTGPGNRPTWKGANMGKYYTVYIDGQPYCNYTCRELAKRAARIAREKYNEHATIISNDGEYVGPYERRTTNDIRD